MVVILEALRSQDSSMENLLLRVILIMSLLGCLIGRQTLGNFYSTLMKSMFYLLDWALFSDTS